MTQPQKGVCRSCKADILWIATLKGKAHPVDPQKLTIYDEEGAVRRGWITHFATCPSAAQHRKPKGKSDGD